MGLIWRNKYQNVKTDIVIVISETFTGLENSEPPEKSCLERLNS